LTQGINVEDTANISLNLCKYVKKKMKNVKKNEKPQWQEPKNTKI
jgi:hypothetical protein